MIPEPGAPGRGYRRLSSLGFIVGLTALGLGSLAGISFTVLSLRGRPMSDAVGVTTIGLSMVAVGWGFGGGLAWAGYRGLRRRETHPFQPALRWFWISLVGLGMALVVGQAIISFDMLAPVTFPPFHLLGMALPAVAILMLVGYGVRGGTSPPTQRQIVGQASLGAFGAVAFAFALEVAVVIVGVFLLALVLALTPGGLAQMVELQAMLADPFRLQDPQTLARWLLKPWILIPGAILLTVIAPLIEEGAKSIGAPLFAWVIGEKPSPVRGWLWGMAVGTGFAITESLLNGAANLPFWAGIALLRVGSTVMHVATAGLTGLGWARTLAARRPWSLLGSYLASVALHGLWNGLTVLMVVASLWIMAQPDDPARMAAGGLGVVVGLGGLLFLTLAIIGLSTYITLRVRRG